MDPAARRARDIARTHGLGGVSAEATWSGATSDVFACAEAVIKIAHPRPDAVDAIRTDVATNRFLAERGVAVPAMWFFAEEGPVAYAVLERVAGHTIEQVGRRSGATAPAWEAVGRQLSIVHGIRRSSDGSPVSLRVFRQSEENDPRAWLTELVVAGLVSTPTADAIRSELAAAAPAVPLVEPSYLCHGDVNASNVLIRLNRPDEVVLLDWAGAGWLDPVWDMVGTPTTAVPALFAGHRARAALPDDETAVARLTWCRLQLILRRALDDPRPAAVRRSGLEREVAELLQVRRILWR